jgi:hypothetical protein
LGVKGPLIGFCEWVYFFKKIFDFFAPPLDSFFEIHYFLSLSSFFSEVGFLCFDVRAFHESGAGGHQF